MAPLPEMPKAARNENGKGDVRRLTAVVDGEVQEVGFRAFVRHVARKLRLKGFVENAEDGTVRIIAEGPEAALERLLEVLRSEEAPGTISEVDVEWSVASGGLPFFKVKLEDPDDEMFQGFATAGKMLREVAGEVRATRGEVSATKEAVLATKEEVRATREEVSATKLEVRTTGDEARGTKNAVVAMNGDMNSRFDRLDENYGQIGEVALSIRDELRRLNEVVAQQYETSNRVVENNNEALRQVVGVLRSSRAE
ncbi:MAG TPA: acylphosphatase [Thermoplasmata archaeon]|nr:acylphosphatase [Thermoplasmata archaeon]